MIFLCVREPDVYLVMRNYRFSSGIHGKEKGIRTAADSVQSGWPDIVTNSYRQLRAGAAKTRTKTFELVEEKQKLLDIRAELERKENERVREQFTFCISSSNLSVKNYLFN
ncbi:hypothetical protein TNCV_4563621 [Trichonephila clavipes]|uniref:Uncharacterized protein n=1 Tax=Trichonephila clavipes TaxID=2585209 RepID=A0A8X7BET8_TRICX|nr:hypothetical protein TNCV_4563621 [Trichonephila clavipes]